MGQTIGTGKQFRHVTGQNYRFAVTAEMCAVADVSKKDILFSIVTSFECAQTFIQYLELQSARGAGMSRGFYIHR